MHSQASSYRKLYKQNFSIPLGPLAQYVGNVPVNLGHIATFGAITIIIIVIYTLFLGDTIIFGFGKIFWSLLISVPITYQLVKMDTCGLPLHVFLFAVFKFPFTKKWTVSFLPISKKNNKNKITWKGSYRSIRRNGDQVEYMTLPIEGNYEKLEGMKFNTTGATNVSINPWSKKMKIDVGKYDRLLPESKTIQRWRKTEIEVGRGQVDLKHRSGKIHMTYRPGGESING